MLFVEARADRFQHLRQVLAPYLAKTASCANIRAAEPCSGHCDEVLSSLLDNCERNGISFGPALAFLDQFGYGEVSMSLISRILRFGQCEVFSIWTTKA
jgi:three-Cys-motif partner protein